MLSRWRAVLGPVIACGLAACSVAVEDRTPAQFPANDNIGMYPISARATDGALVPPDSVFVTALIDGRPFNLESDRQQRDWQGMYPLRCRSSFTLQYQTRFAIQLLTSRTVLSPATPRVVRIAEPDPPRQVTIDTSEKSRDGWPGVVHYRFVTEPRTAIRGASIEPLSGSAEDARAAAAISLTTPLPASAPCGMPLDIALHSKQAIARANLVIETDHPGIPRWRTEVDFKPLK
ncbi:MAG TPA: hypothetical protein VLW26_09535 [Steroidobacteraceae bacterium]|nr:hypothetical protein [Steroidobacteraceae bacterium]